MVFLPAPPPPPEAFSHNCCSNNSTSNGSHYSDDEASGALMERDYTGMFEGPEKTLEVVFRRIHDEHFDSSIGEICDVVVNSNHGTRDGSPPPPTTLVQDVIGPSEEYPRVGLRRMDRVDLDLICTRARCTILSSVSNRYLDAYVLSESSLFVYPYMLVLKTCGTTTLLRCIATLIDIGRRLGLEIDWVGYSRKNFNFPGDQAFPHQSFQQEVLASWGLFVFDCISGRRANCRIHSEKK